MPTSLNRWWIFIFVLFVSFLVSLRHRRGSSAHLHGQPFPPPPFSPDSLSPVLLQRSSDDDDDDGAVDKEGGDPALGLQYDFYRHTCPAAEDIVRSSMARIYSQHPDVAPAFLRLLFHDCFIRGCDASVLLDDSQGNRSHSIERQAIPNRTLKGFDRIDSIKQELEDRCPGVVSCADVLVLATREGIVLAGGPFYPLFTGRRDSIQSYFAEATAEIPKPDDNVFRTLHLFGLRGFDERETVSLLGGHNIGKIGCEFILERLHNFLGTGQPDPTISADFLSELRHNCEDSQTSSNSSSGTPLLMESRSLTKSDLGLTYFPQLVTSISSGSSFDTHYYQSLLRGRGLLYADQQLMTDERTASVVRAYASDDGSAFRLDFARAMMKMSSLGILSGSDGQIRKNCSFIANGN
ncbi:putative Peroxidase 48 [Syzygium oleosum]|uniref:putative Peroxidase 48 n=1 Tax=Syzygium oleosum TaxID=219896 RepID=UPI0011D2A631|nr:putative Peroxidase 48 [Syzygium oleosum]